MTEQRAGRRGAPARAPLVHAGDRAPAGIRANLQKPCASPLARTAGANRIGRSPGGQDRPPFPFDPTFSEESFMSFRKLSIAGAALVVLGASARAQLIVGFDDTVA